MRGKTPWNKGVKMSEEFCAKVASVNVGRKPSEASRKKRSETMKNKRESLRCWKGGITPENNRVRQSVEMRLWRESVFARDNWTCQACGKRGSELNAHHIKAFSEYHELRLAIDNGQTLCVSCHNKTKKTNQHTRRLTETNS
jgi:5-methylcytosine-specific restriction endonuclease McrA